MAYSRQAAPPAGSWRGDHRRGAGSDSGGTGLSGAGLRGHGDGHRHHSLVHAPSSLWEKKVTNGVLWSCSTQFTSKSVCMFDCLIAEGKKKSLNSLQDRLTLISIPSEEIQSGIKQTLEDNVLYEVKCQTIILSAKHLKFNHH